MQFPKHSSRVLHGSDAFVAVDDGFAAAPPTEPTITVGRRGGLSAALPRHAEEAIRFHQIGGFEVRVREEGASGEGAIVEGAVTYRHRGGASFWSATEHGYEEWLMLDAGTATARAPAATWEVEGASLREVEGAIEIAGADGVARVHVTAPIAFGSGERVVPTRLRAHGSRIELWADAEGEPILIDPVWSTSPSMSYARYSATAVTLGSGKVLVVGGYTGSTYLSTAELYNPADGTWAATGSLATGRYFHRAVVLADGKVLVMGGYGSTGYLQSTELYDPDAGTWTTKGSLTTGRYYHTAVLLGNNKVLAAGGHGSTGSLSSAELYDPALGTWSSAGSMSSARYGHTATWIGGTTNKVLVVGGYSGLTYLSTYQLYDQSNNTWGSALTMTSARAYHAAVALSNGSVLVSGGTNGTSTQNTAQIYSPTTGWSAANPMNGARQNHTATLLSSGDVLVAGGTSGASYIATTERYSAGNWSSAGSLLESRAYHATAHLGNGNVLVTGGYNGTSSISAAELYTPAANTWTGSGALSFKRWFHAATTLQDGRAWVAGGYNGTSDLPNTQAYDPATNTWSHTATISSSRSRLTVTRLQDGNVLIAGGSNGGTSLSSAQVYNPLTNTYLTSVASMNTARVQHTATLLPDGKVLVTGGLNGSALSSAELFDPVSKTWTTTASSMGTARYGHTAVLIGTTRVLVAGGHDASGWTASAELYDVQTGAWTTVTSMSSARGYHTATSLPNGKVLVAGGTNGLSLQSAELFTLGASPPWSTIYSMATARSEHSATSLANGWVLLAGGTNGTTATSSVEIYDPNVGWLPATSMSSARYEHTATLLQNGSVLLIGGNNVAAAETYTPPVVVAKACTTDTWNQTLGQLTRTTAANGTPCDDGNACTQTDTCQSGLCTGSNPVVCTAQDQCHAVGTCSTSTGVCSNPSKANGASCSDANACTQTDTCQSGVCTGSNPVVCTAQDQCHDAGICNPDTGGCSNPSKANGASCSDANACTQTDTCQSGVCTGSSPVVCTAQDQCHIAGTCNTSTGACSNPSKANGTSCDDRDACKQTDTCQSGVCTGSNPVVCTAQDQCHVAGICDPDTGGCSNPPKTNGTACNDGNACTTGDACQASCEATSITVKFIATDCWASHGYQTPGHITLSFNGIDADVTVPEQICQPNTRVQSVTIDDPTVLGALRGCHDRIALSSSDDGSNVGLAWLRIDIQNASGPVAAICLFDVVNGSCSSPEPQEVFTEDYFDDSVETAVTTECPGTCNGTVACVGTSATCSALDSCHLDGVCDPATGACSNPTVEDGTVCDDGVGDTAADTCVAGACAGTNLCLGVTCAAADPCHTAGTCNVGTGRCTNPRVADGTPCDDGDPSTTGDVCSSGICGCTTGTETCTAGRARADITSRINELGLTADYGFRLKGEQIDGVGQTHVRWVQLYHDIPVVTGSAVSHLALDGTVQSITDGLIRDVNVSVAPTITSATAAATASMVPVRSELRILPLRQQVLSTTGGSLTGNELNLNAQEVDDAVFGFKLVWLLEDGVNVAAVDAHTGALVSYRSAKRSNNPTFATGQTLYYGDQSLACTEEDGTFFLGNTGAHYAVYDDEMSYYLIDPPFNAVFPIFGDNQSFENPQSSSNRKTAGADAAFAMDVITTMYGRVFDRVGMNGKGSFTPVLVHSDDDCNAGYDYFTDAISFTDGCGAAKPFDLGEHFSTTTIDIVGHEYTHGVMDYTADVGCNLCSGEGWGLDEGTGDIFGEMAKFFFQRDNTGGWRLRTTIPGGSKVTALTPVPRDGGDWIHGRLLDASGRRVKKARDMKAPKVKAWYPGVGGLDEHVASGPLLRAFFFLAQGSNVDMHTKSKNYTPFLPWGMKGIGNDAAARIFYTAFTTFLAGTHYKDYRAACVLAALSQFPSAPSMTLAVVNAFAGVNVGDRAANYPQLPPVVVESEPNDTIAEAKTHAALEGAVSTINNASKVRVQGTFQSGTDVDVYRIAVPCGKTLEVTARFFLGPGKVQLRNAVNSVVQAGSPASTIDFNNPNGASCLTLSYLRVESNGSLASMPYTIDLQL